MCSASSFMEIKMLREKILFQEVCAWWKQMLVINKKAIFSIKKYLLIQSMTSSCFKNSKHPSWRAVFWIKINAIQNPWMTINVIGHSPRKRIFYVPLVWSCFWYVPASSSMFGAVSFFRSSGVLECSGLQNYYESTSCRFYYKALL